MPFLVPSLWTEDEHDRRIRIPWRLALDVETPAPATPAGPGADAPLAAPTPGAAPVPAATARASLASCVWAGTRRLLRTGPGLLIATGAVGALLLFVMGLLGGLSVLAWLFVSPVSGAIIVLAVGIAAAVNRELEDRGDAVKHLALRRGLCPGCGYSLGTLGTLVPTPDGCIVCPECSAAWKIPGSDAPVVVLDRPATLDASPGAPAAPPG